ncbi:ferritin family protein [candidate division WOR-3 bacterium]|nr:ferritin family protein [candidate division WOR-3 bacterium]
MSNNPGLNEALQAALGLEQKGYDHYKQALSQAKNPLTESLFSTLADQELDHMRRIRELFEVSPSEPTKVSIPRSELEKVVRNVFEKFSKEDRSTWDLDITEAYEHAMHLEQESITMYGRFAKESKASVETAFFKALEQEEVNHFTALQNAYHYLKHTSDWFESSESETWNWMNT